MAAGGQLPAGFGGGESQESLKQKQDMEAKVKFLESMLVGSGAGGTSTSLSIYIYKAFFRGGNIGQAVAASVLFFLAALLLIALLERFSRRMETT